MSALTGPALVTALLLALAGAMKAVDPTMTVGALRALRLALSPWLVRIGAGAEVLLGAVAVTAGGPLAWGLVAASYLGFAAFVAAALRRGTMIGSCGCFGREETPPHPSHVVLNLALAAIAAAAALAADPVAPLDAIADQPGAGAVVLALSALAVYLLYAAFVELPRTLAAGRAARR